MLRLTDEVRAFFERQGFVIVSTIDAAGTVHNACKGIVNFDKDGTLYLLDLYFRKTFTNLKRNHTISVTAVNEHDFSGYCLKGKGKIVSMRTLPPPVMQAWEAKITSRISQRLIRNIRGEQGHPRHPEAALPQPQYMIAVQINEVIDLTPAHIV